MRVRDIRLGRSAAPVVAIWLLGLVATRAPSSSSRPGSTRRAAPRSSSPRCTISKAPCSRSPSTPPLAAPGADRAGRRRRQLAAAKRAYNASLATLAGLRAQRRAGSHRGGQRRYFRLVDRLSAPSSRAGLGRRRRCGSARAEQPGASSRRLQRRVRSGRRGYGADAATLAHRRLVGDRGRDRVPARWPSRSPSTTRSGAPAQPRGCDDRRAHRARQPPQALRRHGGRAVALDRERDAGRRHLRSRRLQGLQRHVRPSRRRRAAGAAGRPAAAAVAVAARPTAIGGDEFVVTTPPTTASALLAAPRRRSASSGDGLLDRLLARLDAHPSPASRSSRRCTSQTSGCTPTSARAAAVGERGQGRAAAGARRAERGPRDHLGHVAELAASTAVGLGLTARTSS